MQKEKKLNRSKGHIYVVYLLDRLEPEMKGMRPDKLPNQYMTVPSWLLTQHSLVYMLAKWIIYTKGEGEATRLSAADCSSDGIDIPRSVGKMTL